MVEGHMTALVIGKQLGLLLIDGPAAGGGGGIQSSLPLDDLIDR